MCFGGSPKFTLPPIAEPQEAPAQPIEQRLMAAPLIPAAPPEKNKQAYAKTRASSRKTAAKGKTGKRRYKIPLASTPGNVAGVTTTGVNT